MTPDEFKELDQAATRCATRGDLVGYQEAMKKIAAATPAEPEEAGTDVPA